MRCFAFILYTMLISIEILSFRPFIQEEEWECFRAREPMSMFEYLEFNKSIM